MFEQRLEIGEKELEILTSGGNHLRKRNVNEEAIVKSIHTMSEKSLRGQCRQTLLA